MTTKQELVDGLKMIAREGDRITSGFSPEDWQKEVYDDEGGGWNRKQVYCHITALAEVVPGLAQNLGKVPEGGNAAEGMDIGALNAQMVAGKESLSEAELVENFKSAYGNLAEFVEGMPEEQLEATTAFGEISGKVVDVMDSLVVLHGLSHIYAAGASAAR